MKREAREFLPDEIEVLIQEVLHAADLGIVEAFDVEWDLRAHFEDGLARSVTVTELIDRFGDPATAGRTIREGRSRTSARERRRRGGWWMSPKEWLDETRRAARRLARAPGFALIVVLTLGLGVGANTAIFTVLNAVLLQDLPYLEPDRLVRVYESTPNDPEGSEFLRAPMVSEFRSWDEVFDAVGTLYSYREVGADLTDGDVPRRITIGRVAAGYFETMGIGPMIGRTFLEDESFGPGENVSTASPAVQVAILSNRLWLDHFDGDEEILGRTAHLDGAPFEIVGVMPKGFNNPFGSRSDLWVPQDLRPGRSNSFGNYYLSGVARLPAGVTLEAAQERARTLARAYTEVEPDAGEAYPMLVPLQRDVVGATRSTMLWILAGAAGLVLLTACVNVANLLFARGLGLDRDLALRSALGSGRSRLIATILLENGILAGLGGLVGLAVGWGGVRLLVAVSPNALPAVAEVQVGQQAFMFALVVTVGALVAFGLTPALRLSRTAPADVLRSGDRTSTIGRVVKRLRDGLVVAQLAAAVTLVAGATLLTRSFDALLDVPLGIETDGVLTFEVHLPSARYVDGPARHRFHEEFQERVAGLPGVSAVGATSWLPVNGRYHTWMFNWDPEVPDRGNDEAWYSTDVRVVTGDYFGSLGIEMLKGTDPESVDVEAEPMAWINQAIVDEVFGETDPLGQQLYLAGTNRRVMGVVEDIPHGARGEVSRKSYLLHAQYSNGRNWALIQTVKARGNLAVTRELIREELQSIDPQLVLYRPSAYASVLETVRAQDRFATLLMGAFAGLALILSLVGTYGVLAGSVAGRTREFGIRMALGADTDTVRSLVLRYAARLTIPGVVLGMVGAWIGGRWIETLLFGIEASDPVAMGGSVVVFVAVGFASAWVPARRATRVDTVQALTSE